MQTLTQKDLNFVVRRLPRDVRDLLQTSRLFVAGGFIRETIAGGEVKDIDMFGPDKDTLFAAGRNLARLRVGNAHITDNAMTVLAPPRMPVQMITRWCFSAAEPLVKSFDFTVCQAAIWYSPSSGLYQSMTGDNFYSDLAARRLVYTHPDRDEEAGGSMMRVRKFLGRGYNIQADSLGGVMSRVFAKVRTNDMPHYAGETTEQAIARIVTGLLVEVDPSLVVDGLEPINEFDPL